MSSSFDDEAVLRYILAHVKTIVQKEGGGVSFVHLQRQLAKLPPRALGRYQPTAETIRLAIQRFPGAVYVHRDGRVYACAKPGVTSRPAPPVERPAALPAPVTPKSGTPAKVIAQGRITEIKERGYGSILTHHPVQYSVFYHVSATSGWPAGSGGPKVGDPVEVQVVRSPAGHNCKYQANVVRYAGNTVAAAAQASHEPNDKRAISDRVGIIRRIEPKRGIIAFGEDGGESAFFDKRSMPNALLRPGESLMDVFSVGEKVCFEAQPYLKGDGLCKWYATVVGTVQRGCCSVVFNEGPMEVCFSQRRTASEKRAEKGAPPSTSVAGQEPRSASYCSASGEHAAAPRQRQCCATSQEPGFQVPPADNYNSVTYERPAGSTRQGPTSDNNPASLAHRPAGEASPVPERQSQSLPQTIVSSEQRQLLSSRENLERPEVAGGVHDGGRVLNVETAHQLAAIIKTSLFAMFQEELTSVLSEELDLTVTELRMLEEAIKRRTMN